MTPCDLEKIKEETEGSYAPWHSNNHRDQLFGIKARNEIIPALIAEVEALRKDLQIQTNLAVHYEKSNEAIGDRYMALRANLELAKEAIEEAENFGDFSHSKSTRDKLRVALAELEKP